MVKIIGYRLFAFIYMISRLLFKADSNRFFCVMTHDSSKESGVGVVITAIKEKNSDAKFVCVDKASKSKWGLLNLFFVKPVSLARAKTILMDNEFLPLAYINLRKDVKVVQLWHGTGTIKKFGHDISEGTMLDIVKNADSKITHLIVNSQYTKKLYSHTFGVNEEKVYVTGIPRTDMLFDEERIDAMRDSFFKEFPQLKGKKLVLYAPTFRDEETDNPRMMIDENVWCDELCKNDNIVLMLRLHPFVADSYVQHDDGICNDEIINMSSYKNLNTLLSVADVLITDYSSIIFEYIVFDRPVIFYAYDLDKFENDSRGFYENYREYVPGVVVYDTNELVKAVKATDNYSEKRKYFLKQSYEYTDGKSTDRLLDIILEDSKEN